MILPTAMRSRTLATVGDGKRTMTGRRAIFDPLGTHMSERESGLAFGGAVTRDPEVRKELGDLVPELLQSLQVVRDSVVLIKGGAEHQVIPLAGQLRALLLEKRRDAHPLLLSVVEALGVDARVHVMPASEEGLPEGLPEPIFHLAGFPFSTERELPGQVEIQLKELADRELVRFESRGYSVRDVIKFYADRAGGAHYSKAVPEAFARLLSLNAGHLLATRPMLSTAMRQIGEAVLSVALEAIRQRTDCDWFLHLAVPAPREGAALLDAAYPGTPMRMTVSLGKRGLVRVVASGLDRRTVAVESGEIDWGDDHCLRISLRHDNRLLAHLSLKVDEDIHEATCSGPVFLESNVRDYDLLVNRGHDGPNREGAILALAELAVVGHTTESAVGSFAEDFTMSSADPARRAVLYRAGGSGRAPAGTGDLVHDGEVVMSRMSSTLSAFDAGNS